MAGPGYPRKYKTVEELQKAVDKYFNDCDKRERPYTVAGLAYFLGFADRRSVFEYSKIPEYAHTIKGAKLRMEMQRTEALVLNEGSTPGQIFDLKNNFGWRDQLDVGPDDKQSENLSKLTDEELKAEAERLAGE